MKKLILTLGLFLTLTSAFAQSGAKDGEFDLAGVNELRMIIDAGMEITLTGTDTQTLSFEYDFAGNDEAYKHFFQNFDPEFESRGGEARLIIDFPNQSGRRVNHQITKHTMKINLPRSVFFELTTRYSKVSASDFERGISIENRSGNVTVQNVKQAVSVRNEYGNIKVTNVEGEVILSNRSANVDMKDVIGDVGMSTEYSKMNISKIQGSVDISNRSGTLNAFDITGDMTLSGSYMDYELTNISGDIHMSNKSGKVIISTANSLALSGDYTNVEASNITGSNGVEISGKSATVNLKNITESIYIDGQYLKINLQNIGGEARIYNKSAAVTINGLERDLLIDGEYIPITVRNFKGKNLQINDRSGDISVAATNTLEIVNIESQYGNVELIMAGKFSGQVNIETRYGKFDTNMQLTTQQVSTSDNERVISGKVGNGPGQMIIKTRNADIKIEQK